LRIHWNTIPTAKQLKYFGSIIQDNCLSDLETEKEFFETRRIIGTLNSVMWNINMFHSTNLLIYK
jgi:hypothetical protein